MISKEDSRKLGVLMSTHPKLLELPSKERWAIQDAESIEDLPDWVQALLQVKQRNTIQDDIADMFNEENPEGTYQRTMKEINNAVKELGDAVFDAVMTEVKE